MLHARKDYQRIQDPLTEKREGKGIGKDEPVFLLRAQDRLFIPTLQFYVALAQVVGCGEDLQQSLRVHIEEAKLWNLKHPVKTPDL